MTETTAHTRDSRELDSALDGANPRVVEMFDRISGTYDRLNTLFSLGVDRRWRRIAIRSLCLVDEMRLLDCSAGTGDMSFEAHRQCKGIHTTIYDPAANMLRIAGDKARERGISAFDLVCGSAEEINYPDASFDRFTVAFGIRNFRDLDKGLAELCRVLKPGGCGSILEFTPDRSAAIDRIFKLYTWWFMRPVGGTVSRDRGAYRYLAETIQRFPKSHLLVERFRTAGFSEVQVSPLSFGIATNFVLMK